MSIAEYKTLFFGSWKRSARLSGTWGAIVGALTLIINADTALAIPILIIVIPLNLLAPVVIGFIVTKQYASNQHLEPKIAAKHGAVTGVVYALVMIAIALFFIIINYMMSTLLWGDLEIAGEGMLVIIATILLGLPAMTIIGIIGGGIGGAVYTQLKNKNSADGS